MDITNEEDVDNVSIPEEIRAVLDDWKNSTPGIAICDRTFALSLQQIHDLLLTNSNFYLNFQKDRGATELDVGNWVEEEGVKSREVCYNLKLTNMIGPKDVQVREIQRMKEESVPNKIYIIEICR